MNNKNKKSLRVIVDKYFNDNTDAKIHVEKAFFAYHTTSIRENDGAHNFEGPWRDCKCKWCGRSRETVRWDDQPAQCSHRPELPNIKDVIYNEEIRAVALINKASKDIPKILGNKVITGTILATLHHTYGYDPETVNGIINIPTEIMKDYEEEMKIERSRSRSAIVKQNITVKSNNK